MVYYNEIEPYCVEWLYNLMSEGMIPAGYVDDRPIQQVKAEDLEHYTQCHFFAGLGGWAYALRLGGWPEDRPVWTGSCPCQPFSAAGKRKGTADERHLWPEFHRLIEAAKPATVFGEQVESKDGRLWLSGVHTDLEALGYQFAAADLCAAGVSAPHRRQRLWWVGQLADSTDSRRPQARQYNGRSSLQSARSAEHGGIGGVAYTERTFGWQGTQYGADDLHEIQERQESSSRAGERGKSGPVAHSLSTQLEERSVEPAREEQQTVERSIDAGRMGHTKYSERGTQYKIDQQSYRGTRSGRPSVPWDSYEWLPCIDGKARRIEPGTFPLAHGIPSRMGKLRAYGNAIVPQVAAEFIIASMQAMSDLNSSLNQ